MRKKLVKVMALLCVIIIAFSGNLQARSLPAMLAGSALATAGMTYTSLAGGFFFEAKKKEDQDRLGKHMLAGAGATFAGLCLLGIGASR